jgi:hypothetical protein
MGLKTNLAIEVALFRTEGILLQGESKGLIAGPRSQVPFLFATPGSEAEGLDPRERDSQSSLVKWERAEKEIWRRLAASIRQMKGLSEEQRKEVMVQLWLESTK